MGTAGVAQEKGVILPDYYPNKFSGFGRIDQIGEKVIVLDERQMKLSNSVTFHTPQYEFASKRDFKVKMLVGFITNSTNEIVSIWLIKQ